MNLLKKFKRKNYFPHINIWILAILTNIIKSCYSFGEQFFSEEMVPPVEYYQYSTELKQYDYIPLKLKPYNYYTIDQLKNSFDDKKPPPMSSVLQDNIHALEETKKTKESLLSDNQALKNSLDGDENSEIIQTIETSIMECQQDIKETERKIDLVNKVHNLKTSGLTDIDTFKNTLVNERIAEILSATINAQYLCGVIKEHITYSYSNDDYFSSQDLRRKINSLIIKELSLDSDLINTKGSFNPLLFLFKHSSIVALGSMHPKRLDDTIKILLPNVKFDLANIANQDKVPILIGAAKYGIIDIFELLLAEVDATIININHQNSSGLTILDTLMTSPWGVHNIAKFNKMLAALLKVDGIYESLNLYFRFPFVDVVPKNSLKLILNAYKDVKLGLNINKPLNLPEKNRFIEVVSHLSFMDAKLYSKFRKLGSLEPKSPIGTTKLTMKDNISPDFEGNFTIAYRYIKYIQDTVKNIAPNVKKALIEEFKAYPYCTDEQSVNKVDDITSAPKELGEFIQFLIDKNNVEDRLWSATQPGLRPGSETLLSWNYLDILYFIINKIGSLENTGKNELLTKFLDTLCNISMCDLSKVINLLYVVEEVIVDDPAFQELYPKVNIPDLTEHKFMELLFKDALDAFTTKEDFQELAEYLFVIKSEGIKTFYTNIVATKVHGKMNKLIIEKLLQLQEPQLLNSKPFLDFIEKLTQLNNTDFVIKYIKESSSLNRDMFIEGINEFFKKSLIEAIGKLNILSIKKSLLDAKADTQKPFAQSFLLFKEIDVFCELFTFGPLLHKKSLTIDDLIEGNEFSNVLKAQLNMYIQAYYDDVYHPAKPLIPGHGDDLNDPVALPELGADSSTASDDVY